MAAGSTYTPISTTTLSGGTSYTFNSIPSTYTDLVLILSVATASGSSNLAMQFNADTGSNYSFTRIYGSGSTYPSSRANSVPDNYIGDIGTTISTNIIQIQNYSSTSVSKTALSRSNDTTTNVQAWVTLWRSTSAINAIKVYATGGQTFANGSTLTLYGIAAA